MANRRTVSISAIALCVLAVIFVWRLERGSVLSSSDVQRSEAASPSRVLDSPLAAQAPSETDRITVATEPVAQEPLSSPPVAESRRFSGILAFPDGGVPPTVSLEIYAWPEAPLKSTKDGKNKLVIETGVDGSFSTDELFPGTYALRVRDWSSLQVPGIFQVPSTALEVLLEGYLLRVRTIAEDGAPLANALVSIDYVRDYDAYHDPSPVLQLSALSRADGVAWLGLPDPGVCDIRFTAASLAPDGKGIAVRGPSGIVEHTLVRRPEDSSASLRVVLRDCEPPGELIENYCFRLYAEDHAENFVRLCSEHAPTGTFPDLRAGAFTIQLVPRYGGEPAYYFEDSAPRAERLVLVDEQETVVELCAVLGGRMSLLVESAGATPPTPPAIDVRLLDSTGTPSNSLGFRKPDRTGVTFGGITFGEELLTERLLPAGDYEAVLTAPGFAPGRARVTLVKGRATRATCVLHPVE
jgi:hypothetical protein